MLSDNKLEFKHNGARCFNIKVPNIGPAKAIYYDLVALRECIKYIKKNNLKDCIIYILACRIGPFMSFYKRLLKKMNIELYVNPDGHEWKRAKWSSPVRAYWKLSERLMVKYADLLICDSINIEKYIKEDYSKYNPRTTYIPYGADLTPSSLSDSDEIVTKWFSKKNINFENYYLIVGRFVPENNYELIINEFMKSKTSKDLVIITNIEKNKFYDSLRETTDFESDKRIKFVGTVYNQELLKKIREKAYAYLHGHEVGGTNPSLLEAMAVTNLNILLGVGFNYEVGQNAAVYFNKNNSLNQVINKVELFDQIQIKEYSIASKNRIEKNYT